MFSGKRGTILPALVGLLCTIGTGPVGCSHFEEAPPARYDRPRPAVVRRPALPPSTRPVPVAAPRDTVLGAFPSAEAKPALTAVYQVLVGALTEIASQTSLCRERSYRVAEWEKARQELAEGVFSLLAAYARDTWARTATALPELQTLERAVRAALPDREIEAPLLDGVLWLAATAAMEAVCDRQAVEPDGVARGLVQWATSSELQYHVAFGVLPIEVAARDKGMGVWADNATAKLTFLALVVAPHAAELSQTQAVVKTRLSTTSRGRTAGGERSGLDQLLLTAAPQRPDARAASNITVRLEGAAAQLDCDPVAVITRDVGPTGHGNGVAERGELVVPQISCANASSDAWLTSESLIVRAASPCLVVTEDTVIVPETSLGARFTVALPEVLIADACGDTASITLDLVSSHGRSGRLKLDIRLPNHAWSAALTIDQDRAGHSEPGDASSGLAVGRRAEIGVTARGDAEATRYALLDLRTLDTIDEKVVAAPSFGQKAMVPAAGGWRSVDDLDLTVASQYELAALKNARAHGSLLGRDENTVWFRLTTTAIATAARPRATTAKADPTLALFSAWQAARPGLAYGDFRSDLTSMILATDSLLKPDAIARSVSPSYDDVAGAVTSLVKWKLLSGDALAKALAHLDQLRGYGAGQVHDRDLGRRLIIAAAIGGTFADETRADLFQVADVLRLSPAESLVRYSDAMLESRVLAVAKQRLGPRARSVLPQTVTTIRELLAPTPADAPQVAATPAIPPDTVLNVHVRYLPIALSTAKQTGALDQVQGSTRTR